MLEGAPKMPLSKCQKVAFLMFVKKSIDNTQPPANKTIYHVLSLLLF